MSERDSTGLTAREPSRFRRIVYFAFAGLLLFYGISCIRIARQSEKDEAQPADVIVVFGAAEYAGRPSPIFRARLDHAYGLFEKKLAPIVIVSGGAGNDPKFTEGGVGRDYLMSKGIGDRHLIAETQGDNTSESSERVAVIMRANGWHTAVAVSDGYHLFRIKRMMARQGMKAYASPRAQDIKVSTGSKILTVMREALSYMLWTFHIT
jgi:uncharacterized SAM-binding protein YcdF (DUF218 family)